MAHRRLLRLFDDLDIEAILEAASEEPELPIGDAAQGILALLETLQ